MAALSVRCWLFDPNSHFVPPSLAVISHVGLTDCGRFLAWLREIPACLHGGIVVLGFGTLLADTLLFTSRAGGSSELHPTVKTRIQTSIPIHTLVTLHTEIYDTKWGGRQ